MPAREAYLRLVQDDGDRVYGLVCDRLARALGVPVSQLTELSQHQFFEQKVPLGNQKGLTNFSFLIAAMWEQIHCSLARGEVVPSRLKAMVALAAVYTEQAALDQGRHQVAWLLTALDQPPFNLTSQNTVRNQEEPFGLLCDPSWLAVNLAYLKDLDFLDARQKALSKSPPVPVPKSPPTRPTRPRPPRVPKGKAKGAEPPQQK